MSISATHKIEQSKEEGINVLAENMFRELRGRGLSEKEVLALISCLIEKITEERKRNQKRNLTAV